MKCSVENGLYDYIREKARRIIERNKDYGRGDTKLHVLRHSIIKEQAEIT